MDGARSMVERGDWLVPYYRGEPFFDKPALTYWLMALSFRLFGFTTEAARLVSVLAALGVIAATVLMGMLLFDRKTALASGFVLSTTVAFLSFGRLAMSDMLLSLFSTLAVTLAVAALRPGASPALVPGLGAVLGLGFLTKGPVALLFPGLAILALLWPRRRERWPLDVWGVGIAAALFVALGLGWFVALALRLGPGPLEYFFLRENVERFAGEAYDVGRAPWYYLPAYVLVGLPWSLLLPLALWRGLHDAADGAGKPGMRLLAGWLALSLVPLTLSRGKLDYYLLPLYPAISLLVARYLVSTPWKPADRVWSRTVLLLAAAGFVLAAALPMRFPEEWLPGPGPRLLLAIVGGTAAIASVLTALHPSPARLTAVLGLGMGGVTLVLAGLFVPAFREGQPNREVVADIARERTYRPDARVVFCSDPARVRRDLLFAARVDVEERCDLWHLAPSRLPFLLLLDPQERSSLSAIPGFREIAARPYLPATALTLGGFVSAPEPRVLVLAANYATTDPIAEAKRKRERKRALAQGDEER
jgi:4-amino-4-deoxy-L-arabinose transferase-like glycosyltransferase